MIRRTFLAALALAFAPKAEAKPKHAYKKAVILVTETDQNVLVLFHNPQHEATLDSDHLAVPSCLSLTRNADEATHVFLGFFCWPRHVPLYTWPRDEPQPYVYIGNAKQINDELDRLGINGAKRWTTTIHYGYFKDELYL